MKPSETDSGIPSEATHWVTVAPITQFVLNKPIVIQIDYQSIAVYKLEDGFYAIEDNCSHQALPLSDGPCVNGIVECPFHGATFCIKTGKVLGPPAYVDIQSFPTRTKIVDGLEMVQCSV